MPSLRLFLNPRRPPGAGPDLLPSDFSSRHDVRDDARPAPSFRGGRSMCVQKAAMSFDTLGLPEALQRALADAKYDNPTAVQSAAIPPALAGPDLMVSAS